MWILWYRAHSLLSRLIRFVTRSEFSHTAIMVDGVLYEALPRGLVRVDGDAAKQRVREASAMKYLEASPIDQQQVRFWLDNRVGKGYSVSGLLTAFIQEITGRHVRVVFALADEFVCSGIAAAAIQIAGYIPLAEPRLETPESLYRSLNPVEPQTIPPTVTAAAIQAEATGSDQMREDVVEILDRTASLDEQLTTPEGSA